MTFGYDMELEPLSAIGLGVFGFLLAWAVKHLLDRLRLLRVIDCLARQNPNWAKKRARHISTKFANDLRHSSDIRLLMLHLENRTNGIICLIGSFSAFILAKILLQEINMNVEHLKPTLYLAFAVIIFLPLLFYVTLHSNRLLASIFTDASRYRSETIARLKWLLTAAGLSEGEIDIWLAKVPSLVDPKAANSAHRAYPDECDRLRPVESDQAVRQPQLPH